MTETLPLPATGSTPGDDVRREYGRVGQIMDARRNPARTVYELEPEEQDNLRRNSPGVRWWVQLERDDEPDLAYGPYPSAEAAQWAMNESLLIEDACTEFGATECWVDDVHDDDAVVALVDLGDPNCTGNAA